MLSAFHSLILGRPMSPHLTVYQWTIPMAFSALNRIFAFGLVFGFFLLPVLDFFGSGDAAADISSFRFGSILSYTF